MSLDDIRGIRLQKLKKIKDAFPIESKRDASIAEVLSSWSKFSKKKKATSVCGRAMAIRGQGALIFVDLYDGTGKIQGLLKKEIISDEELKKFEELVDIGDFLEISGTFFITKRGEKTVEVKSWRMLSKSLLPLPEKWEGLKDPDLQMRQRYLHLLSDKEAKARFEMRFRIIDFLRKFFNKEGYMEVETPILQPLYGGASAFPFTTRYNALDSDFYLRISPELYLKRLLVGGFNKIFEMNRNFRNEGIDVTHSPEFTMLEFYSAYESAAEAKIFIEKLFKAIVREVHKKLEFIYDEHTINAAKPFAEISFFNLLKKYAGLLEPENLTRESAQIEAERLGVSVSKEDSLPKILDNIYKKYCRAKIIEPTFVVDYPADYLPLAKKKEGNQKVVDAFQLIVGGIEIVKAFSELNDPLDQRARFEEQERNKKIGEEDAQRMDEDFLEALEYGAPPSAGAGIGVDRLVMLLTNTHNIRDIILFPTLKPKK